MAKRKAKNKFRIILWSILLLIVLVGGFAAYKVYTFIFEPAVLSPSEVLIEKTTPFVDLAQQMENDGIIASKRKLLTVAELKRFDRAVMPGRYLLKENMSNNDIIDMYRSGNQTPVKLVFHNIRTRQELAGVLGNTLMNDSIEFLNVLLDEAYIQSKGFDIHTAVCPFIPNTYEVYWNTSPKAIYERMLVEYNNFWTDERKQKATAAGLTPQEVIILASIVEEETKLNKEKPIVAGLYLNRLRKGILLQADPTLRFALHDFTIKRILNKYKEIDSPYNTYKYVGLPPGPIRMPDLSSINAVLNYQKHDYLFMCAKADFSGEHAFAKTLREHNANARAYHNALNQRRIYK